MHEDGYDQADESGMALLSDQLHGERKQRSSRTEEYGSPQAADRQPEVGDALNRLGGAIGDLEKTLAEHEQRLIPIMRGADSEKMLGAPTPERLTPLARVVEEQAGRVEMLCARLRGLGNRIEV